MRGMVERHAQWSLRRWDTPRANLTNPRDNRSHILHHHLRRHPQRRHALRAQEMRARPISLRRPRTVMPPAIHLDIDPCGCAIEIEHIDPGRVLAAKLEPARPLAQFGPQHDLRQRHFLPQFACALESIHWPGDHCAISIIAKATPNPPRPGEGDHRKAMVEGHVP